MESDPNASKLRRIKRYDVIRSVGEGGMGKVYLAMDKLIRRPVAIKVFSMESVSETRRQKIVRDFFLETRTAGSLLHPNIVVIYDVGKKTDLLYMVMEFVYGKTLLAHQRMNQFSIKKALELVYELALALEYAHSKGVIHRDIKPENIILSHQGVPKITDFGIARFRRNLKRQRPALVGSSRFMAPEQVLMREQDHRVDIYQLGVVLFELLTRQTPFKGSAPSGRNLPRSFGPIHLAAGDVGVCSEPLCQGADHLTPQQHIERTDVLHAVVETEHRSPPSRQVSPLRRSALRLNAYVVSFACWPSGQNGRELAQ